MAKLTYKSSTLPPEGKYLAVLLSANEIEGTSKNGNPIKQIEWIFQYEDNPEIIIKAWSFTSLNPYKNEDKSLALQIVEALSDKQLSIAEQLRFEDTDLLIARKCYITVEHIIGRDNKTHTKITKFEGASTLPF